MGIECVHYQQIDEINQLTAARASVDFETSKGKTALTQAAICGEIDAVHQLLRCGADVNRETRMGRTALTMAVYRGEGSVVECLLAADASVDHITSSGFTAVLTAAYKGRTHLLGLLLDGKADLNHQSPLTGCSALMMACSGNRRAFVREAVEKWGADLNYETPEGRTALTEAALFSQVQTIEALVELKADVNHTTSRGFSALSTAAMHGNMRSLHALLKCGALAQMDDGQSALLLATVTNQVPAASLLLQVGVPADSTWTNQPVGKGSSALGVASWSGHKEMATLLLAHEASPNLAGSNGDTPVTCCSRSARGHKVIDILVSHGACVAADQPSDGVDPSAGAAIVVAAARDSSASIDKLLRNGADVDTEWSGITPLIAAVRYGRLGMISHLVESRAECN